MEIIPKEDWAQAHHAILFFGRYYSTAKNPKPIDFLFEGLEWRMKSVKTLAVGSRSNCQGLLGKKTPIISYMI